MDKETINISYKNNALLYVYTDDNESVGMTYDDYYNNNDDYWGSNSNDYYNNDDDYWGSNN